MSSKKSFERISKQQGKDAKKGKERIIIISSIVGAAIVIAIIVIVLLNLRKESYNQVVTPNNIKQIISQLDKSELTPIGSYEVLMNNEWNFDNGSKPSSNAYVSNSIYNQNTVFLTLALDNGEQIYKSPDIPVGSSLDNIVLDKNLKKGSYDVVATYHLISDAHKEISTVSVSISITVLN
jgi:hypothetical protein